MKVKVTFEYELEGKQREQFEDVRTEEGEAAAFYFLEDLVKKKLKSLRLLKQSTKNKTKQNNPFRETEQDKWGKVNEIKVQDVKESLLA